LSYCSFVMWFFRSMLHLGSSVISCWSLHWPIKNVQRFNNVVYNSLLSLAVYCIHLYSLVIWRDFQWNQVSLVDYFSVYYNCVKFQHVDVDYFHLCFSLNRYISWDCESELLNDYLWQILRCTSMRQFRLLSWYFWFLVSCYRLCWPSQLSFLLHINYARIIADHMAHAEPDTSSRPSSKHWHCGRLEHVMTAWIQIDIKSIADSEIKLKRNTETAWNSFRLILSLLAYLFACWEIC